MAGIVGFIGSIVGLIVLLAGVALYEEYSWGKIVAVVGGVIIVGSITTGVVLGLTSESGKRALKSLGSEYSGGVMFCAVL